MKIDTKFYLSAILWGVIALIAISVFIAYNSYNNRLVLNQLVSEFEISSKK